MYVHLMRAPKMTPDGTMGVEIWCSAEDVAADESLQMTTSFAQATCRCCLLAIRETINDQLKLVVEREEMLANPNKLRLLDTN